MTKQKEDNMRPRRIFLTGFAVGASILLLGGIIPLLYMITSVKSDARTLTTLRNIEIDQLKNDLYFTKNENNVLHAAIWNATDKMIDYKNRHMIFSEVISNTYDDVHSNITSLNDGQIYVMESYRLDSQTCFNAIDTSLNYFNR